MPSSADRAELEELTRRVETLAGTTVEALTRTEGGGNNRLYRADTPSGPLAVKVYLQHGSDPRDRLGTEFGALEFLGRHRVGCVPAAIACDRKAGIGVFGWIEGQAVGRRVPGDIPALAGFMGRLAGLKDHPEAAGLPEASEACLSMAELERQIRARLARLREAVLGDPPLDAMLGELLEGRLSPLAERVAAGAAAALGSAWERPLPAEWRTLSPSDFGTHNARRRPDGSLAFVDFEYFGWDDPVKLVADTVLHPAMTLDADERASFRQASLDIFGGQPGFADRLDLAMPLYALRWALIVLNPFLPERWARWSFATGLERRQVLETQLDKARGFLNIAAAA